VGDLTTTSLAAELERIVLEVVDSIAQDGLMALKRVLDSSGFAKSPLLQDYEVLSHVRGDEITFEILVSAEALDVDTKKLLESANAAAEAFSEMSDRVYKVVERGGFSRVALMRDKRHPVPSALNRPKRTRSYTKPWGPGSSKYGPKDHLKSANQRKLEHGKALGAPRDMNINREGKLSVQFRRQTRTAKSGRLHFPQGHFEGIMKKFMDELQEIIIKQFIPEFEDILVKRFV
jgi:hypothetical protein